MCATAAVQMRKEEGAAVCLLNAVYVEHTHSSAAHDDRRCGRNAGQLGGDRVRDRERVAIAEIRRRD